MKFARLYVLAAAACLVLVIQLVFAQSHVTGGQEVAMKVIPAAQGVATPNRGPGVPPAPAETVVRPDGHIAHVPAFRPDNAAGPPSTTDVNPSQRGYPAIQPHQGSDAQIGPITEADVRAYNQLKHTHGIEGYPSTIPVQIESIAFLTAGALRAAQPAATVPGLPDSTEVCYVVYQGNFVLTEPGGSNSYPRAFEVFDVHTGNQLVAGVGPGIK
ncbi:MAG TPA: hypothetical protein VFM49_31540 [Chloroflexia bacterium]|jgi:hypothetical protein|nr:hypothetical protein [Chloroflexia bacterium]